MISNCSIVTLIAGVKHLVESVNEELTEKDVYLSYLPLEHIFDRVIEEFFISRGALIGFWRGLKSSIFCAVPHVLDRVHSGKLSYIPQCADETDFQLFFLIIYKGEEVYYRRFLGEANCLRRCLMWYTQLHSFFKFAYVKQIIVSAEFHKFGNMKKGTKHEDASFICDRVVLSKVNSGLGGNVRLILSGAAPLYDHVEKFLRGVACCHTCAGTFVSLPNELSMLGTVGPPVPNVDRCLESVPEMGYDALASIPRGEICVRGDYFQGTTNVKTSPRRYSSMDGDVGEWQPNGSMKIIDRKNIFKLSQGEYVAVENLENVFGLASVIDSIWIYGNSFESFLVAVVNPKKQALENWAAENGVHGGFNSICQNPKAKRVRSRGALKDWKREKLKGFEFIKAAHTDPVPFDMERDLLTPTYKKKRSQLLKYYQSVIDNMYKSANKPNA
ncbi:long chain acyl-CoA synthetase 4 [Gossypium australe]|uniref:Long chain acyl-CoA synthetase 4 n=1 Tax=Gossypium australe TaxID=47621 RepID=A0A5B6US79_9ROSI|nr:long chain acyl-CoA synthetase 4 [Gossypium australe]